MLLIASIGLSVGLLLSATVNITLRRYSRLRMSENLRRRGREHLLERLFATQGELAVSAATLRTSCSLALVLVLLRGFEQAHLFEATAPRQYGAAFLSALAVVAVFGVAIPSAWSKYAGEGFLAFALPLLLVLRRLFFPLIFLSNACDALVRRLAGVPHGNGDDDAAQHEQDLLDAVSQGELLRAVGEEEKEMIESIIEFRDSDVAEIMTPRTEMEAIEVSASLDEIKTLIREIGHSRIPIFEENIDNVVGIIYAKDLLHITDADFNAKVLMRKPLFIPMSKNLRDLLHELRTQKVHMAIVLDEYGGTAGLVTIEDILEELVGDIVDEYDEDEPEPLTHIDADTVDIDARMRVDEINEELDIKLPDTDDYETVGGFVFSTMGHVPAVGERCTHDNVEIQVIDAEPRRIIRLRLHVDRNGNRESSPR